MTEKKESKNLEFIKEFSGITVKGICKDLKIDSSNLYKRARKKDTQKVRKEIQKRYTNLYNKFFD